MSACLVEFSSYMKSSACSSVETPSPKSGFPKRVDVHDDKRAMSISEYFPNIKKLADRLCKALSKVVGLFQPRATEKREGTGVTGTTKSPPVRGNAVEQMPGTPASIAASNGDHLQLATACRSELSNESQDPGNQLGRSEKESWGWDPEDYKHEDFDKYMTAGWTLGVEALQDPAAQS